MPIPTIRLTSSRLIALVAVFLLACGNIAFFSNVTDVYAANGKNIGFLISLFVVFANATFLLLSLVSFRRVLKPVLITVLLLSSLAAYFMDSYDVVIDHSMIENMFRTDPAEARDLLTWKLAAYLILLGIIPSIMVYRAEIVRLELKKEALSRLKYIGASLAITVATLLIFSNFYASFFREHKPLRFYSNPGYYIYSAIKYARTSIKTAPVELKPIATDSHIPDSDIHRELVVFVVGETARADRFSLNGYERETNPLLKQESVINFADFWSCGTSTAVSVPCMFSVYTRSEYDGEKVQSTENLLDILSRSGVNVLWLDNNSDSKGTALRIPYESYKTADKNPVCDEECRDEGMLFGAREFIETHPEGDIFIVLHQMGSHGPAYYRRYPLQFERFTPTCRTSQLEDCSREQIDNTYDNTILYTDHFLARTIALLKEYDQAYETAMFYVSDHGESLGENGLYLHGLPDLLAPDEQKHVPAVMWIGSRYDEIDVAALTRKAGERLSHDHIFHTLLSMLEVETEIYDDKLTLIRESH